MVNASLATPRPVGRRCVDLGHVHQYQVDGYPIRCQLDETGTVPLKP